MVKSLDECTKEEYEIGSKKENPYILPKSKEHKEYTPGLYDLLDAAPYEIEEAIWNSINLAGAELLFKVHNNEELTAQDYKLAMIVLRDEQYVQDAQSIMHSFIPDKEDVKALYGYLSEDGPIYQKIENVFRVNKYDAITNPKETLNVKGRQIEELVMDAIKTRLERGLKAIADDLYSNEKCED